MKVAVLFSGGKDSVFTAFVCAHQGHDVCLLTIVPSSYSKMFHHPNTKWCSKQAKALGMPIRVIRAKKEESEKKELERIKAELQKMDIDAIASGAIESEYQKQRIEGIAHELGVRSFSPLWRTGDFVLREQYSYLDSVVVAVSAEGLGKKDLGAKFDSCFAKKISELPLPLNRHLEGGEGETFVLWAPFFKYRIFLDKVEKIWDGVRGVAKIKKLNLKKWRPRAFASAK